MLLGASLRNCRNGGDSGIAIFASRQNREWPFPAILLPLQGAEHRIIFLPRRRRFVVWFGMTITLKPEQETWLEARVASGEFASIEEAARQLIDERIADREFANDDLSWAKPLVDEGLAALDRGKFISLEEHKARNAARLAALRG